MRLLYVEIGGERVPLSGSAAAEARNATRAVSALSASIGPFAWLAKGNDARIKAGAEWAPNVDAPKSWYWPGPAGYIDYPVLEPA